MSQNNTSTGGLSLVGVLTIVFVVLKLIGVITWSWLWVLSPLWIAALLSIAGLIIAGLFALAVAIFARR